MQRSWDGRDGSIDQPVENTTLVIYMPWLCEYRPQICKVKVWPGHRQQRQTVAQNSSCPTGPFSPAVHSYPSHTIPRVWHACPKCLHPMLLEKEDSTPPTTLFGRFWNPQNCLRKTQICQVAAFAAIWDSKVVSCIIIFHPTIRPQWKHPTYPPQNSKAPRSQ